MWVSLKLTPFHWEGNLIIPRFTGSGNWRDDREIFVCIKIYRDL